MTQGSSRSILSEVESKILRIVVTRLEREGIVGVPYFQEGNLSVRIHSVDEYKFPLEEPLLSDEERR